MDHTRQLYVHPLQDLNEKKEYDLSNTKNDLMVSKISDQSKTQRYSQISSINDQRDAQISIETNRSAETSSINDQSSNQRDAQISIETHRSAKTPSINDQISNQRDAQISIETHRSAQTSSINDQSSNQRDAQISIETHRSANTLSINDQSSNQIDAQISIETQSNAGISSINNQSSNQIDEQISSIKDRIKARRQEIFDTFASNVTLHGFSFVANERGRRKFAWTIIMLTAISLSFILFFNTILDYPTQSITEFAVEKNLDKLDFPTITVCNSNSPVYAMNAYNKFPVKITFEEFIKFYNSIISHESTRFKNLLPPKNVSRILNDLYRLNYTTYKEVQKLFEKHKYEDFFDDQIESAVKYWKCLFDRVPCETNAFKQTLHWELSMCQQFNGFDPENKTQRKTTTKYGHPNGLLLIRNTESRGFSLSAPVTGLAFFIHPYGVPHHLIKNTVNILAKPGAFTQVEIEPTEVTRLRKPYEPHCGDLELKMVRKFPYTKAICEIDSILDEIYRKCHCIGWEFAGFTDDGIPICNVTQMLCLYEVRKARVAGLQHGANKLCPIECLSTKYSVVTSELSFGNEALYKRVMDELPGYNRTYAQTEKYIKDNFVAVRIGFKSLSKRVEAYKPAVSWYGLIGTVGGSVGLCLGFSVITGFEALFFLFDYLYAPWYVKGEMKHDSTTTVN